MTSHRIQMSGPSKSRVRVQCYRKSKDYRVEMGDTNHENYPSWHLVAARRIETGEAVFRDIPEKYITITKYQRVWVDLHSPEDGDVTTVEVKIKPLAESAGCSLCCQINPE